jgi:hypothetical protein
MMSQWSGWDKQSWGVVRHGRLNFLCQTTICCINESPYLTWDVHTYHSLIMGWLIVMLILTDGDAIRYTCDGIHKNPSAFQWAWLSHVGWYLFYGEVDSNVILFHLINKVPTTSLAWMRKLHLPMWLSFSKMLKNHSFLGEPLPGDQQWDCRWTQLLFKFILKKLS